MIHYLPLIIAGVAIIGTAIMVLPGQCAILRDIRRNERAARRYSRKVR